MSIFTITFDSNVWRIVASPHKFPDEPSISSFETINSCIKSGNALGFLAETVFTLEAIKRVNRRTFFQDYMPTYTFSEVTQGIDRGININIASDSTSHPGNNSYLTSHLNDALQLGFKVLPCPRIAWIRNPDLQNEWFISLANEEASFYQEMFGEVVDKIKSFKSGSYDLEQIGQRYVRNNEHWTDGLKNAPETEDKPISKALAEWADGDAIATHVAHKNKFFCTRDLAISSGATSVFSEKNCQFLRENYDVKFMTPEDLVKLIAP